MTGVLFNHIIQTTNQYTYVFSKKIRRDLCLPCTNITLAMLPLFMHTFCCCYIYLFMNIKQFYGY